MDSYEVMWERDTSGECPDENANSATLTGDSATIYTITGLEEYSNYTITVTATNAAGSTVSYPVMGMTGEIGEGLTDIGMNRQLGPIISCLPAPSDPPTFVNTSDVTSSSITVQWGEVDCIHRNGNITGYSVRYGVQGSAEENRSVVMISGGFSYEISGLTPSTNYTVEVAAVNSNDTGIYSIPLNVTTLMAGTNLQLFSK